MKIQLAHDSLAAKVYDKVSLEEKTLRKVEKFIQDRYAFFLNRKVLLTQDDLDYIQPYLDKVDISAEQRAFIQKSLASTKQQRQRRLLFILIFLLISTLAAFSLYQRQIAVKERKISDSLRIVAYAQKDTALLQKDLADRLRIEADLQKDTALAQKDLADRLRVEADLQKDSALRQKLLAEVAQIEAGIQRDSALEQKLFAEAAQLEANLQKDTALQQKDLAERLRESGEILRNRSIAQSLAARSLQIEETELKALLAQQAYNFHIENRGPSPDRNIYAALYEAVKKIKGANYNELKGHRTAIWSMVLDDKGKRLFASGNDGKLLSWPIGNASPEAVDIPLNGNRTQHPLAIHPSGTMLLLAGDQSPYLQQIDLSNTQLIPMSIPDAPSPVLDLVYLPDGSSYMTLDEEAKIRQYSMQSEKGTLLLQSEKPLRKIAISPDGHTIVGITQDRELELWKREGDQEMKRQKIPRELSSVTAICFNHRGNRLAIGTKEGFVQLYDVETRELFPPLPGQSARISQLAFSPGDGFLASASFDQTVLLYPKGSNIDYNERLPILLQDHNSWVTAMTFSADGHSLITGSRDGQIKYWPTSTQQLADLICAGIQREAMSHREWELYVGKEIPEETTCR